MIEMFIKAGPWRLETEERIGLIGDTHGNSGDLGEAMRILQQRQIHVLVILGDFGFVWPRAHMNDHLGFLAGQLEDSRQTLFFIDGTREGFSTLHEHGVSPDGIRWIAPNIGHLPRGYRTRLKSGLTLAALGGANSIDFETRSLGQDWWTEESITDRDLRKLGTEPADVLLSHDAPLGTPQLDALLNRTASKWSAEGRAYASEGRRKFHDGFLQVTPKLVIGGRYHLHSDEWIETMAGSHPFSTRVIVLDRDGKPWPRHLAILNTADLSFEFPEDLDPWR